MAPPFPDDRGEHAAASQTWKLVDARARFSEVVRLARSQGAQTINVRGKNAVVVISVEEYERLSLGNRERKPLVSFLEGLHLNGLDIARQSDSGREIDL